MAANLRQKRFIIHSGLHIIFEPVIPTKILALATICQLSLLVNDT